MPSFIFTTGIIVNVALINVWHLLWDLISFILTDADEGESNAGQLLSQKVEHHQQKERHKLINTGLEPAKEGDKYFDFQYQRITVHSISGQMLPCSFKEQTMNSRQYAKNVDHQNGF